MFAKKIAEKVEMPNCNRLAKLSFDDGTVNKELAGAIPVDETLVLGYEGWSESISYLCIRSGRNAICIATGSYPSRDIAMYEDYKNAILLNKLTEEQIKKVFDFIWKNMDLIQPKPSYMFRED